MKELYDVVQGFWHKSRWIEAGDTLRLTEAEAKYLGEQVKKRAAPSAPAAAPATPAA